MQTRLEGWFIMFPNSCCVQVSVKAVVLLKEETNVWYYTQQSINSFSYLWRRTQFGSERREKTFCDKINTPVISKKLSFILCTLRYAKYCHWRYQNFKWLHNLRARHVSALIGHFKGKPILKETLHSLHNLFLNWAMQIKSNRKFLKHW